uniref:Uncharacterized protein LOC8274501 isoform X2 n=1 Tax=Rhizophora mucronata TaxID=61149 RepID=A0A2P2MMC3_RHIMU
MTSKSNPVERKCFGGKCKQYSEYSFRRRCNSSKCRNLTRKMWCIYFNGK